MCDSCATESQRWLDYRLPPVLKIASSSARDDTPAGLADRRRSRFEEWRDTINRQQALIRKHCIEAGHAVAEETSGNGLTTPP